MEKKFSLSDKPLATKIIYAVVIAILSLTAIIIGIVAAANKVNDTPDDNPPADINPGEGEGEDNTDKEPEAEKPPKPLAFIAPLVGKVVADHDLTAPVFNNTLGEWRVHAGIDISAEEGAAVFASEAGVVSGMYSDPRFGYTVEITHRDGIVTRYSNLAMAEGEVKVGDEVASGAMIGKVGDTASSELAEEPHLHFELLVDGKKVHPLDYLTEESKSASLGITEE